MAMMNFALAMMLHNTGEIFVGSFGSNLGKVYYSISEVTKKYSFWRFNFGTGLQLIESGLTKSQALFKYMLLR